MTDQWYYRRGETTHGPLPRAQLAALASAGEIDRATLVWRAGFADWVRWDAISSTGIAPTPPPPPVCPPPPPSRVVARARPAAPPQADPLRWVLLIAAGGIALLAAGAIGWWARGTLGPSPVERKALAKAPAAEEPVAKVRRTVVESKPAMTLPPTKSQPEVPQLPAEPAGNSVPSDPPPAKVEPQIEAPAPAAPTPPPTQNQSERPPATKTLFQQIDVQRAPRYSILGVETLQELQYQLLSELQVSGPDDLGARKVAQHVKQARLIKSDDLSRGMYEKSLGDLVGWQFSYRLNRHGEVVEFKNGPSEGRRSAPIERPGGKGFLVTSVMDEAGWKELAQLTFFVPDPRASSNQPTIRQMTHDFGPLGSWTGTTTFVPKGPRRKVLRIDYVHDMTYHPPGADRGELPFTVKEARFKPETAGGSIEFDASIGRVVSAQDRFVVSGEIATEVLGQAAAVQVQEQQAITVRIFDQQPAN